MSSPSQTGATPNVWSRWPWVSSTATGVEPVLGAAPSSSLLGVLTGVDHDARLARGRGPPRSSWSGTTRRETATSTSTSVDVLARCTCGRIGSILPSSSGAGPVDAAVRTGSAVATNQMRREAAKRKLERQQRAAGRAGRAPQADRADHHRSRGRGRGRRVRAVSAPGATTTARTRPLEQRPDATRPAGRAGDLHVHRPRTSRRPSPPAAGRQPRPHHAAPSTSTLQTTRARSR